MFKNQISKLAAVAAVAVVTLTQSAHAAMPEGVAAAITAYQTDVVSAIGLLIGAGIAIFAVKKLGSKMGWL